MWPSGCNDLSPALVWHANVSSSRVLLSCQVDRLPRYCQSRQDVCTARESTHSDTRSCHLGCLYVPMERVSVLRVAREREKGTGRAGDAGRRARRLRAVCASKEHKREQGTLQVQWSYSRVK